MNKYFELAVSDLLLKTALDAKMNATNVADALGSTAQQHTAENPMLQLGASFLGHKMGPIGAALSAYSEFSNVAPSVGNAVNSMAQFLPTNMMRQNSNIG